MRKKLIAGNWKCHKTVQEACALIEELAGRLPAVRHADVAVMPPFTALWAVREAAAKAGIEVGAQDVYWEAQGAFTGEISATMLREVGCKWVIVGHSERRSLFAESPKDVGKKVAAVVSAGLHAIACVGETLGEREQNSTMQVVGGQLSALLEPLKSGDASNLVVAYEPVWAIGTGRTAETWQAQEVHHFLRSELRKTFSSAADGIRILYGGSVNPKNAAELLSSPDIDGALVGGASLSPESFAAIVAAAEG